MPELAAALNSGSISAAPLSAPSSFVAEQKGNRVIANLAREGIYFVIAGLTTTRPFCANNEAMPRLFCARSVGRRILCSSSETRPKVFYANMRRSMTLACSRAA
jgi:hypothetical protein